MCDTTYTHTRDFMTPYCNVQYWSANFWSGGLPRMEEESFNHAHAKMRNVIECAFEILKARLQILKSMASYPFRGQRDRPLHVYRYITSFKKQ